MSDRSAFIAKFFVWIPISDTVKCLDKVFGQSDRCSSTKQVSKDDFVVTIVDLKLFSLFPTV